MKNLILILSVISLLSCEKINNETETTINTNVKIELTSVGEPIESKMHIIIHSNNDELIDDLTLTDSEYMFDIEKSPSDSIFIMIVSKETAYVNVTLNNKYKSSSFMVARIEF